MQPDSNQPRLILASTSKYRKALLERLGVPFDCVAPQVDEDTFKTLGLQPIELAETLAEKKAEAVSRIHPDGVVIGGDQLVSFENQIAGKPGDEENAVRQLQLMSGRIHELVTSVCIIGPNEKTIFTNLTRLTMRELSESEIRRYVAADRPIDCAGSYKLEAHGITLFSGIESEDHSAISGLPLMATTSALRGLGYAIP